MVNSRAYSFYQDIRRAKCTKRGGVAKRGYYDTTALNGDTNTDLSADFPAETVGEVLFLLCNPTA